MSITARAASEKIQELKSKLAVYDTWAETLRINYLPSDGGAAEIRITRTDGGSVTEAHFHSVLEDIAQKREELETELHEWEGLVFEPGAAVVRNIAEAQPPKKKPAVDRKHGGPRRVEAAAKEP